MRQVIERYFCDKCEEEMSECEYKQGARVDVSISLPNPKGGCGQVSGVNMIVCEECLANLGIVNDEELHDYVYSKSRFTQLIEGIKVKVIDFVFNKEA